MNLADRLPPQNLEWRDIAGWPGYRVSNTGRVQSCRTSVANGFSDVWRDMSPGIGRTGHLRLTLCRNRDRRQAGVHTLVLEAFVGPRPDGTEACHYPDPNPANNHVANLRWDTRKANCRDTVEQGRHRYGERHGNAKLTEADVRQIRQRCRHGATQISVAREFGVSQKLVSMIVRNMVWAHVKEVGCVAG